MKQNKLRTLYEKDMTKKILASLLSILIGLVVGSVIIAHGVDLTFTCHLITFEIFVVGCDLIDDLTIWHDLDDTVCGSLYKLMIAGRKDYNTRELDETVI